MYSKIKEILKDVNLLLVEDDVDLKDAIKSSVQNYVKSVFEAQNGLQGLKILNENEINLIISDINMPVMNGFKMAMKLRESGNEVPIIFLTAYDSDENISMAIDVASFAVLKKPFEKRELIMSMSFAVNKFSSNFAEIDLKNGFKFNSFSKELTKDNQNIPLTKKEQNLLHLFLKNNGRMLSFEMIEGCIWQDESCSADTIRSFVYKLRKKLYPELIQNCQGMGYKLSFDTANNRTINNTKYI